MDGPGDYYPKCSKSDRERLDDIAYMWNLKKKKNDANEDDCIWKKSLGRLTQAKCEILIQ